ncbi:DNA repair protein RadC [Vibrio vulnificus]|nr:DNA repair protein RadC [Vibrio vulnificus]
MEALYTFSSPVTEHQILEKAAEILSNRLTETSAFTCPNDTKDFLLCKLGKYEREVFGVMLLNNQHQLLEFVELFYGTIDSAAIYPREVVKVVLEKNAAAVIFAHNHPSGDSSPSQADRRITERLKSALELIDVSVLDHIVVGKDCMSFAEKGWL